MADLKKSEDATDASRPREKESKVVKALRAAVETYTLKDMESNHLRASNRADRLAVATNKAREFSKNVHAQVAAEQAEVARTMEAILRKTKKAAAAKEGNSLMRLRPSPLLKVRGSDNHTVRRACQGSSSSLGSR